jgi:hypothetical protein
MTLPAFITDLDAIKKMRGSEVLAYARDILNARAADISGLEEGLIRIGHAKGWHTENASAHDAMCGAALALEIVLSTGKEEAQRIAEAKKEGKQSRPMNKAVDGVIDAVRSALIAGIMARAPVEPETTGDAAEEGGKDEPAAA